MRSAPILAFFIMLLACTEARQLLKEKESEKPKQKESDDHDQKGPDNKPVVCTEAPPPLSNNTWPPECKNAGQGFGCKGTCAPGFNGQPTAVCGKKGGWTANGACKPAKCDDDDLPRIANATWGHCDDLPIGSNCTATCKGYLVESAPIVVTCEARARGAGWSTTDAFCGTINTQALLNIEGAGSCSTAGTAAVQQSVLTYMKLQPGVNELKVDVQCFDSQPGTGRRLHQSTVRYVVLVIYVGGDAAANLLVQTAETNLTMVGNLVENVNTATGGAITVTQESVSGDVSGGGSIPSNPQQDAKVSLLRSGADNLQTGVTFYLTAVYKGTSGSAQEGVAITGPTIDPAGAVNCTAVAPAPLTNALGIATWSCITGQTPGKVTVTVEAPNPVTNSPVSASSNLTIGTDCVGAFGEWGACSSVCGVGERSQFYTVTTPAADGGRACDYATGDNRTASCTGPTPCGECQTCAAAGCVDKTASTPCTGGQCETGVCKPSVDCVGAFGDFGACSNVCGTGQKTKVYSITTPAAYGGQACDYATGDNITETCTGPTTCSECQTCEAAGCVNKTTSTPCTGGQCETGVCRPSVDCVGAFGDFGACSNVCGTGQKTKLYTITTPAAYGGQACLYATGDNITETCTGPTTCGECHECGPNGCAPVANGTACPNMGKCYDGICQASVQLVEVKSIPPLGTFPDNNTQWVWLRLTANAIGEVTTLASQSGVTQPGVVDGNIVTTAPEDPRTPGSPIGSALKLATGLVEGEKAEATVVYRNNTPSHPLGLFNGMKLKEFIESEGTLTMSWYRGNWTDMTVGSAPIFRFTVLNPAMLPGAIYGGAHGRIELIWEPTYNYAEVPTNTWKTDSMTLNQGKLNVWMGAYAVTPYGSPRISCYEPLSFWLDPTARCSDKQHPWFNSTLATQLYETDDIIRDGIIWEVRASALNPKSLVYANNIKFTTNKGHNFTYVFTN